MRRSRVGLLWFFGSFATLMSAVGFADGGHEYPSKPADLYRLDLDNAAEGCGADYDGRYRPALTDAPIGKTTAAPITAPSDGLPGSDGWILWPISGSPLAVILYVDDETACQVSCWDGQADSPIDNNVDALEIAAAFGGCIVGPWIDQQAVPADQDFWASDCDDYRCGLAPAAIAVDNVLAAESPADDEVLWQAAAAYAGVPSALVWQHAIEHSARCEFAWAGCNDFVDGSVAGWIDQRKLLASAEAWRAIGRATWNIVDQLVRQRDELLTATSRGVVGWLQSTLENAPRNARELTAEPSTESWPNLGRVNGSFLSL